MPTCPVRLGPSAIESGIQLPSLSPHLVEQTPAPSAQSSQCSAAPRESSTYSRGDERSALVVSLVSPQTSSSVFSLFRHWRIDLVNEMNRGLYCHCQDVLGFVKVQVDTVTLCMDSHVTPGDGFCLALPSLSRQVSLCQFFLFLLVRVVVVSRFCVSTMHFLGQLSLHQSRTSHGLRMWEIIIST